MLSLSKQTHICKVVKKGGVTMNRILKKVTITSAVLVSLLAMFFAKVPVFALENRTDIQTTISKYYDNWNELLSTDDFRIENNIVYPLTTAERLDNGKIVATYEIPKTIYREYNSWDEALAQEVYLIENNITYKLMKAVKLNNNSRHSKILLTYEFK